MWMLLGCLLIALLILIGWNQPFKEHAERLTPGMLSSSTTAASSQPAEKPVIPAATPATAVVAPRPQIATPATTPAKKKDAWMWEEKKMDRPQPPSKGR